MKLTIYTALTITLIVFTSFNKIKSSYLNNDEGCCQIADSLYYEITKSFSEEDLRKLVLKINKKHNALLSYHSLTYNNDNEITGIRLKFIDSQIHESTYAINQETPIEPIIVYKYGDSISGIKKKANDLPETPEHILKRIAEQENERIVRESLRKVYHKRSTDLKNKKPKLRVLSSHTIPDTLLTKEQQALREIKKIDSIR